MSRQIRPPQTSGALFKHLLNPGSMPLRSDVNQRIGTSEFADKFHKIAEGKSYPKNARTSGKQPSIPAATLEKYLLDKNVEIYWPYWQVTGKMKEAPTITYDPITNQETNIGYKRNADGSVEKVNVDDDYAYAHPTWIVMRHKSLPASSTASGTFSPVMEDVKSLGMADLIPIDCDYEGDDCGGYNPPTPKPTTPTPKPATPDGKALYNKLYVYEVKLDGNFRGLFGGDNDVDFYMADEASVTPTSSGTLAFGGLKAGVHVQIDRYAGRTGTWRRPNVILDNNWLNYEIEPAFAVYGRQVKNGGLQVSSTVTAKFKYDFNKKKFSNDVKPSDVKITFPTTDRLLSALTYEREQFFLENQRNADGHGVREGLAIRKSGSGSRSTVYHTYKVQAYN